MNPEDNQQRDSLDHFDLTVNEMRKSVGQFCSQLSLLNTDIPRFTDSQDVFDFLADYETATLTLDNDKKLMFLAKAFPSGRYRSWYEATLQPLIKDNASWSDVKRQIIERFSDTEDRDRHFVRLRELRFNPEGDQKLLDFVEDMLHSYKKAFPECKSEENRIRIVKAAIPQSLKPTLSVVSGYQNATDVLTFKKAIKQFDVNRGTGPHSSQSRANTLDLANFVKQIVESVEKKNEALIASLVAFKPPDRDRSRDRFPRDDHRSSQRRDDSRSRWRNPSPGGSIHQSLDRSYQPAASRNHQPARPSSPHSDPPDTSNQRSTGHPSTTLTVKPAIGTTNSTVSRGDVAFDSETYFSRFGKPKTPCRCGSYHWSRHCLDHLN